MTSSLKKQKGRAYEKLRGDDKAELDNAEVLRRAILFDRVGSDSRLGLMNEILGQPAYQATIAKSWELYIMLFILTIASAFVYKSYFDTLAFAFPRAATGRSTSREPS